MDKNLLDRLRKYADQAEQYEQGGCAPVVYEAIEEIERLQHELEDIKQT